MNAPAPRHAMMGDNVGDAAAETVARLERDYANIEKSVVDALAEARELPATVDDDSAMSKFAACIKKLRDLRDRVEALRVAEKEPHLRSATAIDAFFFGKIGRLIRRNKTDNAGAADVLQNRVDAYVRQKAAAERQPREEEERRLRAEEDRKRREREEQERIEREARDRAERARKPENVEAHQQAADDAGQKAEELRREEQQAESDRREAEAAATAKTADLVRTRTEDGNTVTAKQEGYAEVTDYNLLPAADLWPYVDDKAKEKAVRTFAKTSQYRRQIPGAVIGKRDKAVIR